MIGIGQTLGNFQARLGMDESDYTRGIINAEGVSRVFGNTFATFISNPLLGSIDIMRRVAGAAITMSQSILEDAESVERLSQQTGASEPLLIALAKRLEIAGFNAERRRQSFLFFNKFIADYVNDGPIANEILRQLGVNLEGLRGFDQIFRAILDGLFGIEDQATRAALAARLFGEEAGHDLINAIGGGNEAIDEMIDTYRRLGFVIDRGPNSQLAAMNTNLGFVQQAIEGVQRNLLIEFMLGVSDNSQLTNESIIRLAETLNEDLGPAFNSMGELVIPLINGLSKVVDLANRASDLLGSAFGAVIAASEENYILGTDGNFRVQPPRQTEATRRNRERGLEYLEELGP